MASDILSILSHGIIGTPDGIGTVNDISVEVEVITIEEG